MSEVRIRGNTVGTPAPRPDWNQSNPSKADYIKNMPECLRNVTEEDNGKFLRVEDGKWAAVEIPYAEGEDY
jgi:hypothetical protein